MPEKRRDQKGRLLRNGEVQRSDGKYMFRYIDRNGSRQTVYSWKLVDTDKVPDGKRCQAALRDMEKQILRDLDDNIYTADAGKTTVDGLFSSFMELRTDLRETTRCNYICLYESYVKEELGWKTLKNVRHTDVQKLYMHMVQELHLKTSTVRGVHSILYQMFESAVMDNIIRTNPAANAMKGLRKISGAEQEKRHALTIEEQEQLVEYLYRAEPYKKWAALFTVLLGTGMRIGEALGLRWDDCDFENDTISVNHIILYKESEQGGYRYRISEPKTKAGFRIIPMFQDVKAALLREKEKKRDPNLKPFEVDGYTDFIFLNSSGKVYTPGAVFDVIQRITCDCNREEFFKAAKEHREPCYLPKMSAHILRHTFCTRLCENGADIKVVQDVMGHRNSRTTMDVYNEATAARKAANFRSIEGKIRLA